jgi:glucokinase
VALKPLTFYKSTRIVPTVSQKVITVDFGGTNIRAALAQTDGTLGHAVRHMTEAAAGPEAVIDRIKDAIREAAGDSLAEIAGIGVSAPGPLDPWDGVILSPPNLPGWDGIPLKAILEKVFGCPALVGNDANLAALAEHQFGAGRGYRHMIYLTVSTGVGGGIIINDQLLLGKDGFAGEAGHIVLDPHGPMCNCGTPGCLEALASGTGLARRAQTRVTGPEGQAIIALAGSVEAITAKVVGEAALQGDPLAIDLIREVGEYLGWGLITFLRLFNPQIVIIGGGLTQLGDLLFEPIRRVVQQNLVQAYWEDCPIVPCAFGDDIGLLGGIALLNSQTSDHG